MKFTRESKALKNIEGRIAVLKNAKTHPRDRALREWIRIELARLEEERRLLREGQTIFAFAS